MIALSQPLTRRQTTELRRGVRGCALAVLDEFINQTKDGRHWQVIGAEAMAQIVGYCVRSVRLAYDQLLDKYTGETERRWNPAKNRHENFRVEKPEHERRPKIVSRPRFGWVGGEWKQLANAYQLAKPDSICRVVVKKVTGGWLKAKSLMGAKRFTAIPRYKYSDDPFTASASPADALARFQQRIGGNKAMLRC